MENGPRPSDLREMEAQEEEDPESWETMLPVLETTMVHSSDKIITVILLIIATIDWTPSYMGNLSRPYTNIVIEYS